MQSPLHASPVPYPAITRALAAGLFVNLLVVAIQLGAAWSAHSSGVLADALHASIDLGADALVLLACRLDARLPVGQRPTYEPLALFGLGVLLAGTGLEMIWLAATRIGTTPVVSPDGLTLVLLIAALLVKAGLSRWLRRQARVTGSTLLEASASHVWADALSSLLATLAIAGALAGFRRLDDLVAMAIGAVIIRTGYGFLRRGLMGRATPALFGERAAQRQ
ncbi:cation diffusion facilitator family transporter [Burkholderia alba]|uniref:cation diffusion facilitator family transporter n=1 Tax=Burkholderia alba TaxID=2683677 RepID=UPI002B05DA79|nr:cation diffusion facilitator family transporter [Burkholderia alba]